jgi:preprotein translocase subunit SecE
VSTIQIVLLVVAVAVFFWAWQQGHLLRLGNYVDETKVELRKCTWPTREELKGSTVVVIVSTGIVAVFTVGVDFLISMFVKMLNNF